MDMQMPHMDGLTATAMIRELGSDVSRVPIVAMTANAMVEERDDIADDDVIFLFKGSGRGETREIQKVDFLGLSDTKRGFQDNFSAKTDYVIGVIPLDDPTAVKLTNERWSLGKSLIGRIKKDRKIYGDEEDPAKKPISYTFE